MICQTCKTLNVDEARFCLNCGGALLSPTVLAGEASALPLGAGTAPREVVDDEITRVAVALRQSEVAAVLPSSSLPIPVVAETSSRPAEIPTLKGDSMLGLTIADKYRIDRRLGAGGMGTVYRATRLNIGDEVAIKVLHPDHVAQPQSMERFRREALAAARLKHPNAVSIYDFGVSSDGLVYLVMELVEGLSLRQILKQQGPLTPSAAAEIISQVCAALDEAHRREIVHRDLKPDNIIVNPTLDGLRTKVLDFGIAKLRDLTAGNLTQTGSVMGTPHYMSPEQCLGEELDSRSDIYSLGVVLFEMLTGMVPFNSPISTAVVIQHVNQPPPPPRSLNVSISQDVERVVLHALEKKREARPQSAIALSRELNMAVRGADLAPAPAVPSTPLPPQSDAPQSGMAPTMVLRTSVSGNTPAMPISPRVSTGPQASWPSTAEHSRARRNSIPVVLAVAIGGLIVVSIAAYFLFFRFSAKRAVLDEVRKGNLVKPQGNSAFDLYAKHKADLSSKDKEEVVNEIVPKIEKRGEEIFNSLKQDQTESEDQWAESVRLYTWLNELRPNSFAESRIYFSQASLAFSKKDYDGALPDYQRAAQLQPNSALTLNRLGRVYVNLKDKSSGQEYYRRATVAEPGWISPWINLGAINLELNDLYSAESALRQAIGIDPQKASAHKLLGEALERQFRFCEALDEYSTTLNLATSNPTNTVNVDALRKKVGALNAKVVCFD